MPRETEESDKTEKRSKAMEKPSSAEKIESVDYYGAERKKQTELKEGKPPQEVKETKAEQTAKAKYDREMKIRDFAKEFVDRTVGKELDRIDKYLDREPGEKTEREKWVKGSVDQLRQSYEKAEDANSKVEERKSIVQSGRRKWIEENSREISKTIEKRTAGKPEIKIWGKLEIVDKGDEKPVGRMNSWEVAVKPTEIQKTVKDVKKIEKMYPELKGKVKDGLYLLCPSNKIIPMDKKGALQGEVKNIWRGSSSTGVESAYTDRGTTVLDSYTGKAYRLDKKPSETKSFMTRKDYERHGWRVKAVDLVKENKLGIVLPPKDGPLGHRYRALADLVKQYRDSGGRYIVIRKPYEKEMMPRERQPGYSKVTAAFSKAMDMVGAKARETLKSMYKNPQEILIGALTGQVGDKIGAAKTMELLGEGYAMAEASETRDEINGAAQIFAQAIAEFLIGRGMQVASIGVGIGVAKGMRPISRWRAKKSRWYPKKVQKTGRRGDLPLADRTEAGFDDTIRADTQFAQTEVAEPHGSRYGPEVGTDLAKRRELYKYYQENYFKESKTPAKDAARQFKYDFEGDIVGAIKTKEFNRRLKAHIEKYGPADQGVIRRLNRRVESWFSRKFETPQLREGIKHVNSMDVTRPGPKFGRGPGKRRQHLYGDPEHAKDFMRINGMEDKLNGINDVRANRAKNFTEKELRQLQSRTQWELPTDAIKDELARRRVRKKLEVEDDLNKQPLDVVTLEKNENMKGMSREEAIRELATWRGSEQAFNAASRVYNEAVQNIAIKALYQPDTVLYKADYHGHPLFGGNKLETQQYCLEYTTKEGYRAIITWREDGQILNAFDVKAEGTYLGTVKLKDGSTAKMHVPPPEHNYQNRKYILGNEEVWKSMRERIDGEGKIRPQIVDKSRPDQKTS